MKKFTMPPTKYTVLIGVVALALLSGLAGYLVARTPQNKPTTSTQATTSNKPAVTEEHLNITKVDPAAATKDDAMIKRLQYLIEEEKLAHDVYQKLYEKWGSRVFGNIKQSELSHQSSVLSVMQTRGITDPRSSEVGKFTDPELQKIYNDLMAQGSQSATEAVKVGVAIEELDIADLKRFIAETPAADQDVLDVMNLLLTGSERHLSAFNRQLSR